MRTVSPLATVRLSVSVRVLLVALKSPMAVTLRDWPPASTDSVKAAIGTPALLRLPALGKWSTNWLPLTVALVHSGGVLLVTAWFWKLLASVPAGSWFPLREPP